MSGAERPLTEAERELQKHKRGAEKLKRRCTQQKNKLMTMARQLGEAREENTKLRCALSQAIAKFDEFKESDEEFQKFVATSKQRINRFLESCEEDSDES